MLFFGGALNEKNLGKKIWEGFFFFSGVKKNAREKKFGGFLTEKQKQKGKKKSQKARFQLFPFLKSKVFKVLIEKKVSPPKQGKKKGEIPSLFKLKLGSSPY